MSQPSENNDNEKENEKLNDVPKKNYFSFDVNHIKGIDKLIDEMLYGSQFDDTLHKELDKLTNSIFAMWGKEYDSNVFYVGQNKYGEPIYKTQHFVVDHLKEEYFNHIKSHAAHFVSLPYYYKGNHQILN